MKPLSSFFSYSDEEFEEMGMESPGGMEVKWFSPSEVAATLTALESGLDQLPDLKRKDDVRAELQELQGLAASAEQNSTKMRFYVGF